MLVLASSSPYRRQLLERLRLPFEAVSPEVDERARPGEGPRATALRLAEVKARAIAGTRHPGDLIIGSDQVADLDGRPLGKPGNAQAAFEQLRAMRGRVVVFHTALCLFQVTTAEADLDEISTAVRFREFSDAEALRYLDTDQPFDCAGSAKIEALGIALVERVDSADPTALIGLPLISLISMLRRAGVSVL